MAHAAVAIFLTVAGAIISTAAASGRTAGRTAEGTASQKVSQTTAHTAAHKAGRTAVHASAHTDGTILPKVIGMLTDMQAKGETEQHLEKVAYAKTETWCTTEIMQLESQIKSATAEIGRLTADIAKQTSKVAQLGEQIQSIEARIASTEAELKTAEADRAKEHKDYAAAHLDVSETIEAISRAVTTLKAQSKDIPQAALLQISKSRLLDAQSKSLMQSFLGLRAGASGQELAPEANAYEFQSGGIVEMLERLKIKFQDQKHELEKEEIKNKNAFELVAQGFTDQIEASKAVLEKKTGYKAQAEENAASSKSSKSALEESKANDEKALKGTKTECEAKSKEYAQSQATRTNELEALKKAKSILESEAVTGNAEKHLGSSAMIQDDTTALVQLREAAPRGAPQDTAVRLTSFLEGRASQLHSRYLELVAVRAKADPLKKVKILIRGLISRLQDDANSEMDKHTYCQTEVHKNTLTREQKTTEVEQLTAKLDKKTAEFEQLETQIADLGTAILALKTQREEAIAMRASDKARNDNTIAEAKEAQEAVSKAIQVLKDFYATGPSSSALLQGAEITDAMDTAAAGKPYSGMTGEGSSVVNMLEVVLSDFARIETDTQNDEDSDASSHKSFLEESQQSITVKELEQEHLTSKKDEAADKKRSLTTQLQDTQAELDAAGEVYERLHSECIDKGLSFEDRVEQRNAEIKSLQEALEILSIEAL